ncbi:unnamed protein product [Schistosoma curassoni]|uniref:Uncharacterized protein n=1 Tax=Schistosoma curassoni TaxID=6186 RepID=A0A183KBD7_9TREM|nr:unnamed protein product [Schistosoma curassoni]
MILHLNNEIRNKNNKDTYPYIIPPIEHLLNSITLRVNVPVLSENK